MRKSFVALLLLAGSMLMAGQALASTFELNDELGLKLYNAQNATDRLARINSLGTATGTTDPETIWVGYWAGANTANNWWKVGGVGTPNGNRPPGITNGVWTFDAPQHVHGDSMSGWYSIRNNHTNASGAALTDENRPWWAVEYGNAANYAFNPGGGNKKTFGVTGVWHRDAGSAAAQNIQAGMNPTNPTWAPLSGTHSAWMGLRAHGDNTYVDPITGNPYNSTTVQRRAYGTSSSGRFDAQFPGYIGNMDQMLYRNIDMSGYAGGGLQVRFTYRTNMSTSKDTDPRFRTGWYVGDPLSQNAPTAGNFVSAEAGTPANSAAPIDSFQVYVGVPVEGTFISSLAPFDPLGSGGENRRPIQDPLRRWFNEVVEKGNRSWLYGAPGTNATQTVTVTLPDVRVQALLTRAAAAGHANKLRLVFRVHTNRAFDDANGGVAGNFNSGKAGAAVLDDVQFNKGAGFVTVGDFEAANSIDNTASPDVAWRSTGKPPSTYFHPHDVATLVYQDICGPVGAANRICDLRGVVVSMGLHDQSEASSDPNPLSSEHEGNWGMISPTVNIAGANQSSKDATKNNMNMSASERWATDDYYNYYEMYTGVMDVFTQGQLWQPGFQVFPAKQSDGTITWGPIVTPGFLYFNPEKQCFSVADGGNSNSLIRTSNVNGTPDSIRTYIQKLSQCYRFGVTTGCSPTDGAYLDNMAIAIVDGQPTLLALDIWDIFTDTFPANETLGLPGTANFDTATALVKIGLNTAPTTGNLQRYLVAGDSVTAQAAGDSIRIDLMFRIKPGVGNYVTIGNQSSGLRGNPTSSAPHSGTHFWASYKNSPGTFSGLPGAINAGAAIAAHATAPSGWSDIVWNSARMDTSGAHALFPVQATGIGNPPAGSEWCSTYHESELAARPSLAIARNRCFVIDTLVTNINDPNLNCGTKVPYPPAWVTTLPASKTGYNGSTTTTEGTKILPDGLFTPGTHVQYFVRRQDFVNPTSIFAMVPDTNLVSPQNLEGSTDGHRWQQFSVLPDRWKDAAFGKGGVGMACMLFYDNNDRRGNERVWKAIADSIGSTSAAHRGNADGYANVPNGANVNDAAYRVSRKNQSPGTLWDMYGKKASESLTTGATGIGGRLGYRATGGLLDNKWTFNPPTPEMMNTYYKVMLMVTGDLNSNVWGPYNDQTSNDIQLFTSWLTAGNTTAANRGILVIGESFVEAAFGQGGAQQAFVTDFLATTFQDPNYLLFVPDGRPFVDVRSGSPYPAGDVYGVNNSCLLTNDVVDANVAVSGAAVNLNYVTPTGALLPVGVRKTFNASQPWISQTIGVDIEAMRGRFGTSIGRLAWMYNTLNNVFGSICTLTGSPSVTLDAPNNADGRVFFALGNNPLRAGSATINFGLAKDDFVTIKVFDVSGRLVRTVADRAFKAGEHTLVWDGVDNGGRQLARGVYFTQLKFAKSGFQDEKKLVILK